MRDVFTMGARPVAPLNALRFGEVTITRHLVSGVVSGIGGYGNRIGIPTVGGEVNFDKSYNGNILVNAMAVGLKVTAFSVSRHGQESHNLRRGKTGRDGIHGATWHRQNFLMKLIVSAQRSRLVTHSPGNCLWKRVLS